MLFEMVTTQDNTFLYLQTTDEWKSAQSCRHVGSLVV